jgi:hypothetical protein
MLLPYQGIPDAPWSSFPYGRIRAFLFDFPLPQAFTNYKIIAEM